MLLFLRLDVKITASLRDILGNDDASKWTLPSGIPCPFLWPQCTHLLMATSSRITRMSQSSNNLKLVSWTWWWVNCPQIASVTISQSNRAPLGCGGTRNSHHRRASQKSVTEWCYHAKMYQNLLWMILASCWIYSMNNWDSSEGKQGSNSVLAKCTKKRGQWVYIWCRSFTWVFIVMRNKRTAYTISAITETYSSTTSLSRVCKISSTISTLHFKQHSSQHQAQHFIIHVLYSFRKRYLIYQLATPTQFR